jgi:hypothetical protein
VGETARYLGGAFFDLAIFDESEREEGH